MSPDPYKANDSGADPNVPQSWNRYAYAQNDPVNFLDPSGQYILGVDVWNGEIWVTNYIFLPDRQAGRGSKQDNPWDDLSEQCQRGLETAMPQGNLSDQAAQRRWLAARARAEANQTTLQSDADQAGIDRTLLAAIGIRESGFTNKNVADGAGVGVGVFQITVSPKSGVTAAQAGNLTWAANWAANYLAGNTMKLAQNFPNFDPTQLLQATAASFNLGLGGIGGNPKTIDVGSAGNNYGSNVLDLMDCFQ
jgi:hypothetical protein